MSEINPAKDGDRSEYEGVLAILSRQLLSRREGCVIFLGAGASLNPGNLSLPSGGELSKELADEIKLDWHEEIPLSTIAYYYEFVRDRQYLNERLVKRIDNAAIAPSPAITELMRIVAQLEDSKRRVLAITTNYDQHFERAYEAHFKQKPGVIIYNGGTDANDLSASLHVGVDGDLRAWQWPQETTTVLYKMHGCISRPKEPQPDGKDQRDHNLVITEEDYINFLSNSGSMQERKALLPYVVGRLAESSVLFIGYGLSDWNFRVIFKATAEKHGRKNYAVQYFNSAAATDSKRRRWKATVRFWGDKRVDIINVKADQFVTDLADKIVEEAKQLPAGGGGR